MKKAQLISYEEKKDAQVLADIQLGPQGRFLRMFELIALSAMFSPSGKINIPKGDNAIELKRII
jgi:hypothetical protein